MRVISASELNQKLKTGEKLILLDVREKAELSAELGHITGIVHIPLGELQQRVGELHKEPTLITICKMGGRAGRAAEFLEANGFKNVIVLEGGMTAWNECKLPVAKPETVG